MRSKGILAALCLALLPAPGHADILDGLLLETEAVEGGLDYSLYLPPESDDGRRFAVVYLLHGLGAGPGEWTRGADINAHLDRLIGAGTIAPMIAVMPSAGRSWYVDSARFGGPGDIETAIVRDLVAEIEAEHPTNGQRAIAGFSMGGHGALRLAFGHPETFAAVAAFAPAIWTADGVSSRRSPMRMLSADQREAWFPKTTGPSFDPEMLARQSPFASLPALARLEDPPPVLLAVGDEDYFDFQDGTVEMYLALRRIGMEPELRVTDGGHDMPFVRSVLDEALVFLDSAFADD